MSFYVCVYNTTTYDSVYRNITSKREWNDLYDKVNPFKNNHCETDILDSSYPYILDVYQLEDFFTLSERYPDESHEKIIFLLVHHDYSIAESVLEKELFCHIIQADNKTSAFIHFYDECCFDSPPDSWANYIDWELVCESFENNGLSIELIKNSKRTNLKSEYFIVQTY